MSETPDRQARAPSFSQPPTVFVAVALSSGGWTDPEFGNEIALVSLFDGTAFVDVTDPINPIVLGKLDTHTIGSDWGDIKVYQDVAYIGSEAVDHGMQIHDLLTLREFYGTPAPEGTSLSRSKLREAPRLLRRSLLLTLRRPSGSRGATRPRLPRSRAP